MTRPKPASEQPTSEQPTSEQPESEQRTSEQPDRTVVALLIPVDPTDPLSLHTIPDRSVAISDLLGGGLLRDPQVWLLPGRGGPVAAGGRQVVLHRAEWSDPAPNPRLAVLGSRLGVAADALAGAVADTLLLGAGVDGTDDDVPAVVLATVLHAGWPVVMHVAASGDHREAGELPW